MLKNFFITSVKFVGFMTMRVYLTKSSVLKILNFRKMYSLNYSAASRHNKNTTSESVTRDVQLISVIDPFKHQRCYRTHHSRLLNTVKQLNLSGLNFMV